MEEESTTAVGRTRASGTGAEGDEAQSRVPDTRPRWGPAPSRADADPAPLEGDDVAELKLPSAATVDLAVHAHVAVDDGLFDVSTGVEEPSELQELPEADDLAADRNVVDRSRVRHAGMLADQVLPAGPSGSAQGHATYDSRQG